MSKEDNMNTVLDLFTPKTHTFRLVDGYTGEVLAEVGDPYVKHEGRIEIDIDTN